MQKHILQLFILMNNIKCQDCLILKRPHDTTKASSVKVPQYDTVFLKHNVSSLHAINVRSDPTVVLRYC